jgi:diguanylate cyclase (GGDEF)-like protein
VLCLDLDRFKAVNDTLGHLAGDVLLREVAERLRMVLRAEDTAARIGGDEFAVLLGGRIERTQAVRLAERLIAAVSEPVALGHQQVEIGLSVGLAFAPDHGEDGETVLKRADLALYRAKAEGRGTCCVFENEMDAAATERRELERDLRRALEAGNLALHYQPQVRATNGAIVGFEALVRWTHPVRGPIPPAVFIPLAEETGLIGPLGEWVLRTACREAASWTAPLKLAVNLSPRQFAHPDLVGRVQAILAETGLAPGRLELEITETVIINDLAHALGVLTRLRALGPTIAMDDFGTGYSSLATLQAFAFDTIKIDRAFVAAMHESRQAAAIVRAVLSLGHSLGVTVVAEGVETEAQRDFLTDAGCDEIQGYLTGRPQPIAAFADAINASGSARRGRAAARRTQVA